jgi:single-strand DNA-binding protein
MANLNKVMLIGRLTDKPQMVNFSNGGKVAKFRFAVNNRKKDPATGQWVDDPVYMDVEAFNRGEFGKLADLVEQYLDKGRQVFVEGHLRMDTWEDKNGGGKRSKLVVVVDNLQFLDSRPDGARAEGTGGNEALARSPRPAAPTRSAAPVRNGGYDDDYDLGTPPPPPRGNPNTNEDDIPF